MDLYHQYPILNGMVLMLQSSFTFLSSHCACDHMYNNNNSYFNSLWIMLNYEGISYFMAHFYAFHCMYVCMYVCTVISPKAGWIPIQCRHQMCTHTHTHVHTYTCMHTCPCTAHPTPPLRGVLSQELNGVG